MTLQAVDIGSRRELMVDEALVERRDNVELRLQRPEARGVAVVHDAPWEGNTCCYHTVFQDGRLYRMYYRGSHWDVETERSTHREVACYAESRDGVHWDKPDLGVISFAGTKRNNIVWDGYGSHNFTPFRDTNPDCRPGEEYKALVGSGAEGLRALASADGVHWSLLQDEPVITHGAFDSQNLAFWDPLRGSYVDFHRDFLKVKGGGVRSIMTCTSQDFRRWSEPVWLEFPDAPLEHLYTNAITPYARAPHLYVGFPKRFVPGRTESDGTADGISDGVFMSSRDGRSFRRWPEAFLRPGPQPECWINRNNMIAWGIVRTASLLEHAPQELSLYATEHYYRGEAVRLRRYGLRLDGFVAATAPLSGGTLLTRPLIFAGSRLWVNASTSAAGSLQVQVLAADGSVAAASEEVYGDEIERRVGWSGRADLGALAGRPVRLRFALRDADLFAFRFGDTPR